jgi:AcrR family transcriptional regulator
LSEQSELSKCTVRSVGHGRVRAIRTPGSVGRIGRNDLDKRTPPTEANSSRRGRGEARRLLLSAARDLFNARGYSGAKTREIAEVAGVNEALIYRHFASKATLFRECMVDPFVDFVAAFRAESEAGKYRTDDVETATRGFISGLYDLISDHRGLAGLMLTLDARSKAELEAAGVLQLVQEQFRILMDVEATEMQARGTLLKHQDLVTMCGLVMTIGMASFSIPLFGDELPKKADTVEALMVMVLHGHLHALPYLRPDS